MIDQLFFVLQIKSIRLSVEYVADLLGVEPQESKNFGDNLDLVNKPLKKNFWYIDTKQAGGIDVNFHWQYLTSLLPKPDLVLGLSNDCDIDFFLRGQFVSMTPLIELSNVTLREMASYGFSLGYDVSDLTE